jgi:hypothetical protein
MNTKKKYRLLQQFAELLDCFQDEITEADLVNLGHILDTRKKKPLCVFEKNIIFSLPHMENITDIHEFLLMYDLCNFTDVNSYQKIKKMLLWMSIYSPLILTQDNYGTFSFDGDFVKRIDTTLLNDYDYKDAITWINKLIKHGIILCSGEYNNILSVDSQVASILVNEKIFFFFINKIEISPEITEFILEKFNRSDRYLWSIEKNALKKLVSYDRKCLLENFILDLAEQKINKDTSLRTALKVNQFLLIFKEQFTNKERLDNIYRTIKLFISPTDILTIFDKDITVESIKVFDWLILS